MADATDGDQNASSPGIDLYDQAILDLLTADARISTRAVAGRIGLSAPTVSRRIRRLERTGVIVGYRAVVDRTRISHIDAFTEIQLNGNIETGSLETKIREMPEVTQYSVIAGDSDVLVHFTVSDVDHLQRVVNSLRRTGMVAGTKTLIVMKSWRR